MTFQQSLHFRRNWFLERVLKLGLTMVAKEYQCVSEVETIVPQQISTRLFQVSYMSRSYRVCSTLGREMATGLSFSFSFWSVNPYMECGNQLKYNLPQDLHNRQWYFAISGCWKESVLLFP
jgi:hypothetical protein